MNLIKKIPVPICGLALGLASLGNLLLPYGAGLRYFCGGLAFLIILLFSIRVATNPASVKTELENPVAFSVLPTFSMTCILLSAYLKPVLGGLATVLWLTSIVLHGVILVCFTLQFAKNFNIKTLFPSWFITYVGFVVASVTSPVMEQQGLGQILFFVGFGCYLVLLPLILYRVFVVKQVPPSARPTYAIFAAPIGLCLTGYLAAFPEKNFALVSFLMALALVSYLGAIFATIKVVGQGFYPSFSAFTFPFVINAIGFKMANQFYLTKEITIFAVLPPIAMVVAVIGVAGVLIGYLRFLLARPEEVVATKPV